MIDRCKITDNFQHISEMYENFVSRAGFKPTSPSILFGCDIDFTIGDTHATCRYMSTYCGE